MKYNQMQSATNRRKKAAVIFGPFINFLKEIISSWTSSQFSFRLLLLNASAICGR